MSTWQLMFAFLILIPVVLLWVFALVDLSNRRDLSGLAKGLWAIAIAFLPVVGMIVYFATSPGPTPPGDENDG
jgi:hypothetical protein